MKRVVEIVLLIICSILLIFTGRLLILDVQSGIPSVLSLSWESIAFMLVLIGVLNSLSVILVIVLNNVQNSVSNRLDDEKKILELRLKCNLLQNELKQLSKNESA